MKQAKNMKFRSIIYVIAILLGTSFILQSCLIVQTPVIYQEAKRAEPYDVIIVPGVPYKDKGMADIMNFRVRWAHQLYSEGITKNVIFSGSAVYTPYVEGKIMALMGEALGIPKENIFVEDKAEHSTENMYYSYLMARKLGFTRIAVASDQYQSFMLHEVYERFKLYGLEFIPIPTSFMKNSDKTPILINPETAFVKDFIALPDRQSFADRFKGTRGKYVKEEIKRSEAEFGTR